MGKLIGRGTMFPAILYSNMPSKFAMLGNDNQMWKVHEVGAVIVIPLVGEFLKFESAAHLHKGMCLAVVHV